MNNILISAVLGVILGSTAYGESIHAREVRQQRRLQQGSASGQLTGRETAAIARSKTRLHREIQRDRVDGGGLNAAERRKIARKQDHLSRQISRQKHDNQRR